MENIEFKVIGKNVTIYPLAKIVFPENISIGDETVIDDFAFIYGAGKGIKIGNFCHITTHCVVQSGGLLEIGDFSGIGPGSIILAATDDYQGQGFIGLKLFGDKYRNLKFSDVIIGRQVHIGAGSIILPGVSIGDGCSVGAGSIVTRDLPPWKICYGSPCKPMKDKPREKQLEMEKEFLKKYYKR
jgi:galactoside O-acetyltransferase